MLIPVKLIHVVLLDVLTSQPRHMLGITQLGELGLTPDETGPQIDLTELEAADFGTLKVAPDP